MTTFGDSPDQSAQRDELLNRLFGACLGLIDVVSVAIGDRLGLYQSIGESATSIELADKTAMHPRYLREWLEQQAVTGILVVDDVTAEPNARRYRLPSAHAEVLLDSDNVAYF